MRRTTALCGFVSALCWTALAGAAEEFVFEGSAVSTEISGAPGADHTLVLSGPKAMKTIWWNERRDNPCALRIWGRNLNNMALEQAEEYFACGGSVGTNSLEVGYSKAESEAYIAGLRVCMNRDGDRVKGIQVRGRVPGPGGRLTDTPDEPQKDYPNCHAWRKWVECGEGELASGLIGEFAAGDEPKSFTGMRLLCSKVSVQTAALIPPRLIGAATTLDEISGVRGDVVDLKPSDTLEHGLDTILWGERRDNPCLVSAQGKDLADRNARSERKTDKCSGDVGKNSVVDLTVRDRRENAFISGVRVCMNSGGTRVKAIETEIKIAMGSQGTPPQSLPAPDFPNQRGWQVNGLISQNWKDWVRCPRGQIAVGLRAHFEDGNNPRSLTGLGLICRAYE